MEYNHINLFLEKIKNLVFDKQNSSDIVSKIISKNIKTEIESKFITIKGNKIQIKGSPALRNEVLIRKEAILSDINKNTPNIKFLDIY